MNSVIQEDCYFYFKEVNGEKHICAMCLECAKNIKLECSQKGEVHESWRWTGRTAGYGDYDLRCSMEGCNNIIHQRSEEYDEN